MLMLFQKQKLQSSHPSGCSVSFVIKLKGACNQRKGRANFYNAQSLVDTRSVLTGIIKISIKTVERE